MRADGTLIQRPADAGVDKGKGTCSSVSLVSGRVCGAVRRLRQFTDIAVSSTVKRRRSGRSHLTLGRSGDFD